MIQNILQKNWAKEYESNLSLRVLRITLLFPHVLSSSFICLFWYVYSQGTGRKQPRTGCFCHCCWTTSKREAGKAVSSSQNQTSGHDQTFTAGTTTSLLLVRYYLVVTILVWARTCKDMDGTLNTVITKWDRKLSYFLH